MPDRAPMGRIEAAKKRVTKVKSVLVISGVAISAALISVFQAAHSNVHKAARLSSGARTQVLQPPAAFQNELQAQQQLFSQGAAGQSNSSSPQAQTSSS